MLNALRLDHVGPAPALAIELAPRLNLLTGDNGLGKSFLLDIGWWALTHSWARLPALPHPAPAQASIRYQHSGSQTEVHSSFDRSTERWSSQQPQPPSPGVVIYAQVDGGFSVWDPARNLPAGFSPQRPSAYLFAAEEVWQGNAHCEGLIRDWASWQREDAAAFERLKDVLLCLSPSAEEPLQPGELRRVSLDDPKKHPTLRTAYGQDVALIHASAGIRRIVALAYLLVWTWQEHLVASQILGEAPCTEVLFLIDEVEAHLHPEWQRRVVPALLGVMEAMTGTHKVQTQLVIATHAPLVLASVEPIFDPKRDGLFLLELREGEVALLEQPWAKQGDVVGWLVSQAFGLRQGRSVEAERAIEAAEAWMRDERALPGGFSNKQDIHDALLRTLAGHDPFWPRWIVRSQGAGL